MLEIFSNIMASIPTTLLLAVGIISLPPILNSYLTSRATNVTVVAMIIIIALLIGISLSTYSIIWSLSLSLPVLVIIALLISYMIVRQHYINKDKE